jgi:hypothetical protein
MWWFIGIIGFLFLIFFAFWGFMMAIMEKHEIQ